MNLVRLENRITDKHVEDAGFPCSGPGFDSPHLHLRGRHQCFPLFCLKSTPVIVCLLVNSFGVMAGYKVFDSCLFHGTVDCRTPSGQVHVFEVLLLLHKAVSVHPASSSMIEYPSVTNFTKIYKPPKRAENYKPSKKHSKYGLLR